MCDLHEMRKQCEALTRFYANKFDVLGSAHDLYRVQTSSPAPCFQLPALFLPQYRAQETIDSFLDASDIEAGGLGIEQNEETLPERFANYNAGLVKEICSRNAPGATFNGETYTFGSFQSVKDGEWNLKLGLGRYFDHLATCETLKVELENTALDDELLQRKRLEDFAKLCGTSVLENGVGRSAALGVSTLLVFKTRIGKPYKALLAVRSQRTATDPGRRHVVPAFILQPPPAPDGCIEETFGSFFNPLSVCDHVKREFVEEVFGAREMEDFANSNEHWAYLQSLEEWTLISKDIESGGARLVLLGAVLDLKALYVNLSCVLVLEEEHWEQRMSALHTGATCPRWVLLRFSKVLPIFLGKVGTARDATGFGTLHRDTACPIFLSKDFAVPGHRTKDVLVVVFFFQVLIFFFFSVVHMPSQKLILCATDEDIQKTNVAPGLHWRESVRNIQRAYRLAREAPGLKIAKRNQTRGNRKFHPTHLWSGSQKKLSLFLRKRMYPLPTIPR
ncbi:hypothetical protein FVE85_7989 [Porphyridium purpureum]|uniref:Uncharacterized protein n=1 Tax=Porphyridium purpureum TaxID=35688 RepID=A0A5J4YNE3_PORPP|nr:hypothetical protein FVE85_7989 [Porphyridium purpureum]|eukprot:POR1112..scf295_9